jgi:hypothetical protein
MANGAGYYMVNGTGIMGHLEIMVVGGYIIGK